MQKYLFIFFLLIVVNVMSQNNTDTQTNVEKKTLKWDTLKYRKYERVLIVGVFQQFRNFDNSFEQKMVKDSLGISKHQYLAESKLIGGVVLNYDKFQLSFATKAQPQDFSSGKGNTKVFKDRTSVV